MKRIASIAIVIGLVWMSTYAQPMSGSYTVGGASPDFVEPQDAADALIERGMSGPVFINLRPGIYMRNSGNGTVLRLYALIDGASEANRITFQPDEAAGGHVENVVLQFNRTDASTADPDLVHINVDHITIRNLTLQDVGSVRIFNNHLIRLTRPPGGENLIVDGFVLEGSRLIGSSHIETGAGTDFGVGLNQFVGETTIRGNTFLRLMRAISSSNGGRSPGTVTIEDNHIAEGYRGASGSGNPLGAGIEIESTNPIVRRNVVDLTVSFNGGYYGIFVNGMITGVVEQNIVKGTVTIGIIAYEGINAPPESFLIANNMVGGVVQVALECHTRNTQIVFNTLVGTHFGLRVLKQDVEVLNNIITVNNPPGFASAYDQGNQQSLNLRSDYNVVYLTGLGTGGHAVIRDGVLYGSLFSEYQEATGLDANSVFKEVEFLHHYDDLHLSECQSQDPDLRGIPIAGIADDFDGDTRSTTHPTRGADEAAVRTAPLWGDVFRAPLTGTPFSITAGKFDNLLADGLAIPDYDNRVVNLYHNLPTSRSFELSGTLDTGFKPIAVLFHDFDGDGRLDLIVGGDEPKIRVFWGDGFGNFPEMTEVEMHEGDDGGVLNLVPEPRQFYQGFRLIFVPHGQFFGVLMNLGNRELCFDYQSISNVGRDTLDSFINSVVVGGVGANGGIEIAGVSNSTGRFARWEATVAPAAFSRCSGFSFFRFGSYVEEFVGAGWYSYANSIAMTDFDGDGEPDIISAGRSERENILLRNQGSFAFSPEVVPVNNVRGLAVLDYNNDTHRDFVTVNRWLDDNGVTLFLNDGTGGFKPELSCYAGLGSGMPFAVTAADFDLDGKTDLAVVSSFDSLFVLYNFYGEGSSVQTEPEPEIADRFLLHQNYPNPFNPITRIGFVITAQGHTSLRIYDVLGQEVASLVNDDLAPGKYEIAWDAGRMASGVYFYQLRHGAGSQTRKLLLLR